MLKKNKWKAVVSSIIILLPILYGIMKWNQLPDTMITHWGFDGSADGISGKTFSVFGIPIFLFVIHLVALFVSMLDKTLEEQNPKALQIFFGLFQSSRLLQMESCTASYPVKN